MAWREVNFDGLVGPSHNYAGLSFGNLASMHNRRNIAHPKAAALEGLRKMRLLTEMGIAQAVIPPHPRPAIHRWSSGPRTPPMQWSWQIGGEPPIWPRCGNSPWVS